jgi:hypothetical protein
MSIEGEYRFRIRENERAIIVAALREYVEVLETLIKLHEDPRFKALEGEIPLPPREGLELILNVATNLEYRIERASGGSKEDFNKTYESSLSFNVQQNCGSICQIRILLRSHFNISQTSKPHWRMLTEGFMLQQLLGESGEEDFGGSPSLQYIFQVHRSQPIA